MNKIILASSSIYRKELFERLRIPFSVYSTDIDETPLENESIHDLVFRLSQAKAAAAAEMFPEAICIGSDEHVELNKIMLGKPGDFENAKAQLIHMSGQTVEFHTGVCVTAKFLNHADCQVVTTAVKFRNLTLKMIENYLEKEKPYNSAASFKSETLGSALIERFEGEDPTALIGLPLIALCAMLRKVGVEVV